ncbi:hypothetical protein GQP43_003409 [Salmonella enterica subsp. enterica serovar Newport]|nr:hypothetical protein [Salmonella enterica subsp. enterica]EDU9362376.1 hypothetical protein [Salmonella enterica subsp. enterica]EDY4592599.1 hypothetical protein [Salmonella enterica subsp. enterica serovar Newport]EEG0463652.1 hypothetical protein [Salmonella enterica subsp. enterica serovar Newport]
MSTVNEIITNLVPAGFLFFWWYIPLVSNHRGRYGVLLRFSIQAKRDVIG